MHDEMVGEIEFKSVSYRFPDSSIEVLNNISIKIVEGEHIAIIGQSGAGKTTFLNLMLGIATPTSGEILISGIEPSNLFKNFPGKIAYVPQETNLISGSIRENLLYGIEDWEIQESILWDSLRKANLEDFVRGIPLKLDHPVGELGNALSGGQRQRLVLARALITEPKILVLDEATSAIDLETENSIAVELVKLKHSMTIVSIAHKPESIAMADKVYRLQNTHLEYVGTLSP
jgi:ATP-binding cassette subfamily C protein